MTENLLQKLEEKMMVLLTEIEELRIEVKRLGQENATYKSERENHAEKLKGLLSLIETVNPTETMVSNLGIPMQKPILIHSEKA